MRHYIRTKYQRVQIHNKTNKLKKFAEARDGTRGTYVDAVSEDADVFDPLQPVQQGAGVDQEAAEQHHEDVGESDDDVCDREHPH